MDWWFKFRLLNWYRITRGMTDAEMGKYMAATVDALADRKHGVTELADMMLTEAEEYSTKQSQRRKKKPANGGEPRKTTVDGGEPRKTTVDRIEPEATNKDEEEDKTKKRGQHHDTSGSASASGKTKSPFSWSELEEDKQRYVWSVPDGSLPQFAVWFCQEEGNARAVSVYARYIKKFGAAPFRILLDKFVSSCFAGEEPENRGAAFMSVVVKSGKEGAA